MATSTQPDTAAFVAALGKMSKKELLELARTQAELQKRLANEGPTTDDELHAWIKRELNIDIPRVAVCEGHTSPFQFLADLYFRRMTSAVAMANRGGSKTMLVALLHYLSCTFRPGIEACSVGAIEAQARRAYLHMQRFLDIKGRENLSSNTMVDTRWKNGSRVEVLPGTISAVNGPHPQIVHVDEVELMDPDVFQESRQMSSTNGKYPAQDIITSTRKRGHGPMQKLIDSIKDAESKGLEPPYQLRVWCVPWDTLVDCPRDRAIYPEGVPIALLKPGQPLWTINEATQEFELKPVKHVWKTGENREIWRLILDSGEVVRATPEHKFMLRTGKWSELKDLKPGDSLMPLYRDDEPRYRTGPNSPWNPSTSEFGEMRDFLCVPPKYHTHHVDGSRSNNSSENLQALTGSEHLRQERADGKARAQALGIALTNDRENELRRQSVARSWLEMNEDDLACRKANISAGIRAAHARGYKFVDKQCRGCETRYTPQTGSSLYCETCRESRARERLIPNAEHGNADKRFAAKECIDCGLGFMPRSGRSLRCDECRILTINHTVMVVEFDSYDDVWDIEVEDNHNFVVHGVVLHNCIAECAQQVTNCVYANPDIENPCPCKRVSGGRDQEGNERTLYSTCRGRFFRSRGFLPLADIINTYTKTSPEVWEAQQECSQPSSEGLILPYFDRNKHVIKEWMPHSEYGPIYMSVDIGATAPHSVHWYQVLKAPVVHGPEGRAIELPEESAVCFDELYRAEIGNYELADMIVSRESRWRRELGAFRVAMRFYDPAAKGAQLDFAAHQPPLKLVRYLTREVEEHIKIINTETSRDRFYVAGNRCPMMIEEIEEWHRDRYGTIVDDFDHAMSDLRYFYGNLNAIGRGKGKGRSAPASRPQRAPDTHKLRDSDDVERVWSGVR